VHTVNAFIHKRSPNSQNIDKLYTFCLPAWHQRSLLCTHTGHGTHGQWLYTQKSPKYQNIDILYTFCLPAWHQRSLLCTHTGHGTHGQWLHVLVQHRTALCASGQTWPGPIEMYVRVHACVRVWFVCASVPVHLWFVCASLRMYVCVRVWFVCASLHTCTRDLTALKVSLSRLTGTHARHSQHIRAFINCI
jgi:hypothetical protein